MDEKKKESGGSLLDKIIALTFTRHAKLSEEEFLKAIGCEGQTEEEAVRKGKFALMSACTKAFLVAKNKIDLMNATLKLSMEKKEQEENGN